MTLERTWINRLQSRWPSVDLRHDTFYDPASRTILTTDILIEDVHFSWDYFTPQDAGWRSIAANLSDIAATGGSPLWVLVSIAVPPHHSLEKLEAIYEGIEACCQQYHCAIVGGDTTRAEKTTLSITAVGKLAPHATPGRRHSTKPGNIIAVSGPHGLSRAGLEVLQHKTPGYSQARMAHLRPIPQLRLGQQIAQVLPQFAMMDSSDGLADAAIQLSQTSGVDIVIDASRLTIPAELTEIASGANADPLDWVLYGGEDFQLVVALPPETLGLFPQLQAIGTVHPCGEPGKGQAFLKQNSSLTPLSSEKAFQHFPSNSDQDIPTEGAPSSS